MNRSERVKLITEIANRLSTEEWDIVDLTLRQFELPWSDQWQGEKRSYVVEMIQNASDEQVINLAQHFRIMGYSDDKSILDNPIKELLTQIDLQKSLMISVSTGGSRIQTVNDEYKERKREIAFALNELHVEDPNSYSDLWGWYGKWSDGSLPTYQSRREYINILYKPLIDVLSSRLRKDVIEPLIEFTGWERVDRNVDKIASQLAKANNEEDFQSIGLLCREALISVAQAVYDPRDNPSLDGVEISETDAKRMLEAYLAANLKGSTNEIHRKFAKTAYQLAVGLQHKRTANFRDAALCAEATRSTINAVAIISGQRDLS
jgi:hypothetical protein